MKVNNVILKNFRNYEFCNIKVGQHINVFYGNNAQGKTNFLEGIYYGAFGLSHRTKKEEDILKIGEKGFLNKINFENISGDQEIYIKKITEGIAKKEIKYNENIIKPKEHYGIFNVVMFSPEDLQIVKGDPALRRRFLNMEISQTNKFYYTLLAKYNRIVKQRNKFLKQALEKNNFDDLVLDAWDNEFSQVAAKIIKIRLEVLEQLGKIAVSIYEKITGQKELFQMCYEQKINNNSVVINNEKSLEDWENFYKKSLLERRNIDRYRANTGIGPHRDDLIFFIDNNLVKSFASQGQQRTVSLAIKLAELEYLKLEVGEYPVLLLDDVMSELDSNRRGQLLSFIDGKVQTFITVNDKTLIPKRKCNKYFFVDNGKIQEE